jgi:penicillin-binding protein 2
MQPIDDAEREYRGWLMFGVAVSLCLTLTFRLAYLQLYQGARFAQQAEGNRVRIILQAAPRGIVSDREGRILAANRLSYSLTLYPIKMPKDRIDQVFLRLEKLLKVDLNERRKGVERAGHRSPHRIKLLGDMDPRAIAVVSEHLAELPGVAIEPDILRYYPNNQVAAHVIGYTGEITEKERQRLNPEQYRTGTVIGKSGLERLYDARLRGIDGAQQVEVDARGRPIQILGSRTARHGEKLQLFLDLQLQMVAEKALDDQKLTGAIIVMNPQNGEILAMASRPAFNPNLFSRKLKAHEWQALTRADHPFVNRALSAYPPGSIFKIPMALAALESGRTTAERSFLSTGSLRVGNRVFHDWHAPGFGRVNLAQSLEWSIDTVYYQLGVEMGGAIMSRYAREVGLGEPTELKLDPESAGLIPDPAWKRRVYRDGWWPGDSANMAIGQGAVNVTPLQAAVMVSAIANGGRVLVPRLVDDKTGTRIRKQSVWKPQHQEVVRQGLRKVVTGGTATVVDLPGIAIAGKTGSAESGKRKTHSWFVCYGPTNHPTVAVVVFAEAAGHGGAIAAPIARTILEHHFGIQPSPDPHPKKSP